MDKIALAQKINSLTGLSKEEKAELTQLLHTKRYGLVWEDKPEAVEEELKTQLPVLMEVMERKIISLKQDLEINQDSQDLKKTIKPQISLDFGGNDNVRTGFKENVRTGFKDSQDEKDLMMDEKNPDHPVQSFNPVQTSSVNHSLIEGDNLHALTVLNYTHANKIDVIYIDPPYNTGNKDFKYNDSFVDKEDGYRHSKWLSFMAKRLRLAKNLLSDKGVIFISIDDNEQAQLKLLCDEVFGERCFVGDVIWRSSDNSNNDSKQFSQDHNYTLVYSKIEGWLTKKVDRTDIQSSHYKNPNNDPRGPWFDGNPISSPNPRPNLCYDIIAPNGNIIPPPKNGWRWSKETLGEKMMSGEIFINDNNTNIKRKTYLLEQKGLTPSSLWIDLEQTGHNRQAKYELLKLFHEKSKSDTFSTPKPLKFLRKILDISANMDSTILDFFAGSGTTLHAVMALNAEDGGSRQCILVTNNENNICEEVTYERNKRVIEGYTNAKGDFVAGLGGNNLRYYQTGYVGREKTLKNKKSLMSLASEMLCLKEGVYQEKKVGTGFKDLQDGQDEKGRTGFKDLQDGQNLVMDKNNLEYPVQSYNPVQTTSLNPVRVFEENDKAFMIIYDEEYIDEAIEIIKQLTNPVHPDSSKNPVLTMIKVYIFANGQYPYTEDFEEVLDKIELCALPDAIYRAYQRLLPKEE